MDALKFMLSLLQLLGGYIYDCYKPLMVNLPCGASNNDVLLKKQWVLYFTQVVLRTDTYFACIPVATVDPAQKSDKLVADGKVAMKELLISIESGFVIESLTLYNMMRMGSGDGTRQVLS